MCAARHVDFSSVLVTVSLSRVSSDARGHFAVLLDGFRHVDSQHAVRILGGNVVDPYRARKRRALVDLFRVKFGPVNLAIIVVAALTDALNLGPPLRVIQ